MTAYLGPIGGLVALKCPASLNRDTARPQSLVETTGGRRVSFRGPRAHRSWSLDTSVAAPEVATEIEAIEAGVYGPPPWHWIDPWAQVTNVLTPASSRFADGTHWGGGGTFASDAPVPIGDGRVVRRSILTTQPGSAVAVTGGPGNVYTPVPVVPGLPYTFSLYGVPAQADATLSVQFRDAGDTAMASTTVTATGGIGATQRIHAAGIVPAGSHRIRVVATGFSRLACPQLTWTNQLTPWAPGQGAEKTVLDAVSVSAQRTVAGIRSQQYGTNTYQVIEVG